VAIVKLGAVLLPLNNRFKPRELASVIEDMGPVLVLGDSDFAQAIETVATELERPIPFLDLSSVYDLRGGPPDHFQNDRNPQDALAVMMTSGSTGRSKGVTYTNAGVLGMIFEWSLMEETVRPGVRIFAPVPFAFAPATIWGLMRVLTLGGTLVFQKKFDPTEAVELLQKYDIQICLGGPIIFEQMSKSAAFETAAFPHLRTAITGGARVPVELLRRWMAKGLAIRQLYGLSEVGGITTATSAEDAEAHPDSCGYGGIFSDFKVVGADGSACAVGEPGEILSRTPGVMSGYWNNPAQTAEVLRGGWVHGGDVGYVTEDGRLKFVDRAKDIIIAGGINISPAEIEAVIGSIDGVEEIVVVRAADEKYGEVPAAIVRVDGTVTTSDILAVCDKELADFKIPRYIVQRDEPLPRLASGKIAKMVVREEYPDIAGRFPRVR
jgi:fatty-acyl-CoA synthase